MQYMNNKLPKRYPLFIILFIIVLLLLGCFWWGQVYEKTKSTSSHNLSTEALSEENYRYLTPTSMDSAIEPQNPVYLDLSKYSDLCQITKGGDYVLTGSLKGQLLISTPDEAVHLFMQDVTISSHTGPSLICENAYKLTITLCPETSNYLSDSGSYSADDLYEACLFSSCDIVFNGSGTLTVNGYQNDAIRSKDSIKFLDGNYNIKCKRDGVRGNDGILFLGNAINLSTEENGFITTKNGDDGRGSIVVLGGELSIIAGKSSFVAKKANLYIYNCTINNHSVEMEYNVYGETLIQEGCIR